MPDALLIKGRYEWLKGEPAAAKKTWQDGLIRAGEMGDPYLQGMLHLEVGSRLGDREHLLRAESILEEIDAKFDLATAREALRIMDNG